MSRILRACVLQLPHLPTLEANLALARDEVAAAAGAGAQLVLLPEYFWTPEGPPMAVADRMGEVRDMLERASREHGVVVAGNLLERRGERFANVGVVVDAGEVVLAQEKIHPMPREAQGGVVGGARLTAATVQGVRTGMLVCADILYPEAARVLALQGAEVMLNPVMSPYKEEDLTKGARDAIFIARAYDSAAFVLKAGGFRADGEHRVAGRSLIAAPWGLVARADHDFTATRLAADLDLDLLAQFRKSQEGGFPRRRPDAYGDLVDGA